MLCELKKIFFWHHPFKHLWQAQNFHICSISMKKKEKFHNKYIPEYRPRIYTGYIEDHFTKVHRNTLFNIEDDAPNFEKSLIREARSRRNAYKRKRYLKEMGVKLKPNMPHFTSDQIQHIKFLHSENPDLWTVPYLAMSFGVETNVIKKVLRQKVESRESIGGSESSNFERHSNDHKSLMPVSYQTLLNPNEEAGFEVSSHKNDDVEIKQNQWFRTFRLNNENEKFVEVDSLEDHEQMLSEELLSDEHDELFDDCEEKEEELENDDDFDSADIEDLCDVHDHPNAEVGENADDVEITSSDNVNFYDEDGKFLFKLR